MKKNVKIVKKPVVKVEYGPLYQWTPKVKRLKNGKFSKRGWKIACHAWIVNSNWAVHGGFFSPKKIEAERHAARLRVTLDRLYKEKLARLKGA